MAYFIIGGEDMADTDFATLRNLAFYSGHSPDYFYFKSLSTYRMKGGASAASQQKAKAYNAKAEAVANGAIAALSNYPSFAEDDSTLVVENINKLISFIQQAVEYERSNEIAYFKNKINTLRNTDGLKDEPIIKELMGYLSPENFNYTKVITLINVLLQGVENTKTIVQHEIEHITSVDDAMNNLKKAHDKQLNGLWNSNKSAGLRKHYENDQEAYLKAARDRLDHKILIEYGLHGNLTSNVGSGKRHIIPGTKKWLSSVKNSVDVTVAHWVTNIIHDILESKQAYQIFVQELQANYNIQSMNQSAAESAIKAYLIKTITTFATQNISKVLNNAYAALKPEELADLLTDSIKTVGELNIEGLYDNFGMFGRTIKLFEDAKTQVDLELNEAEGLYDAYAAFRKELRTIKQNHGKLTVEQQFLRKAMKTGTDDDKYSPVYALIERLETLEKRLAERTKDSPERRQNWLKNQSFTVSDKAAGEKVTIQIELDKDGNIDIKKLTAALQRTRALKNLGGRKSRGTTLEGIITGLKTRTSQSIKRDLIEAVTPLTKLAQKKGFGGEKFVIDAIKTAVENKKISVGGPVFSEIKQGIQESINSSNTLNEWIGKLNKKNDFVVVVTVDDSVPDLSEAIEQMIDYDAEAISDDIATALKKASDAYLKDFVDQFYDTIGSAKKEDESFNSYKANADAFFETAKKRDQLYKDIDDMSTELGVAWNLYAKEMKAKGASAEEINKKRQSVLDTFKNSFFQSSTMKTYNQYQSNLGFVGGSLGADLLSQLGNINELFTAAGMPISNADINWLYTAIINCSPVSIIGEKNKNIIEDYLGAMAAFALFDEGGAEAEIISGVAEKTRKGYSSPNILHLYAVDSLYVPGSYVLSKVLEELIACRDNACQAYQSQRKGATIAIVNPMNEGMVPNRGKQIDTSNPPNTDPWGAVANKALHSVKLKILFLAGLLDIAHDIDKTLANIQLPS